LDFSWIFADFQRILLRGKGYLLLKAVERFWSNKRHKTGNNVCRRGECCDCGIEIDMEGDDETKAEVKSLENMKNYLLGEDSKLTDEQKAFIDTKRTTWEEEEQINELNINILEHLTEFEEMDRTDQQLAKMSQRYAKVRSVYVNMYKQPKRFMGDGFLWISLLKYQMARLGLLKLWKEIEASDELVPIGVKTDCIFVAQKV
jgi:hypothetical protein